MIKLNHDPRKSIEGKMQRLLRRFKSRLLQKKYQLYPTGSCAGKFCGNQPKSINYHRRAT